MTSIRLAAVLVPLLGLACATAPEPKDEATPAATSEEPDADEAAACRAACASDRERCLAPLRDCPPGAPCAVPDCEGPFGACVLGCGELPARPGG